MNTQELDILNILYTTPYANQRALSEASEHSLGIVNKALKNLLAQGYINDRMCLTKKAVEELEHAKPRNAIILAAGFGMRMVPINMSTPKALIEIKGEKLIDRLISQLHDVGIYNITVVVGFMKDSFEYLIDEYGVNLVYNTDYASKNNLASLAKVADRITNTYIVPCDIWCLQNPFHKAELYSWYMISDHIDDTSDVRVTRKMELARVTPPNDGNHMIGISYIAQKETEIIQRKLALYSSNHRYDDKFWEETLYTNNKMIVHARLVNASDYVEINTYEQLRDLDSDSVQLRSDALNVICEQFSCRLEDIMNIRILKKGMTNRSFLFSVRGSKYIMRIPGEGTDQLINRAHEADVYQTISGLGICDDPIYINPQNGYKITKYLEGVRVCDSCNIEDLQKCMQKLRKFHSMKLTVSHTFDIFDQINYYEKLWGGVPSIYRDYNMTKANVLSLRAFIDASEKEWSLTHIDAVPDNFLFNRLPEGSEELQLTDWEYAGMQDPHVDIAMFCIYSLYNKDQCDNLIDIYFNGDCNQKTKAKIYAYIAACGLLWSNWCEYKRKLGVEFGEYSLRQYRFAKDYFKYAISLFTKEK